MAAMADSDESYLSYMAIRLLELKRLMKEPASIYLHCDPTLSHYLRLAMDVIFGRTSFQDEILWHYGLGTYRSNPRYPRKDDVILLSIPSEEGHVTRRRIGPSECHGRVGDSLQSYSMAHFARNTHLLRIWHPMTRTAQHFLNNSRKLAHVLTGVPYSDVTT